MVLGKFDGLWLWLWVMVPHTVLEEVLSITLALLPSVVPLLLPLVVPSRVPLCVPLLLPLVVPLLSPSVVPLHVPLCAPLRVPLHRGSSPSPVTGKIMDKRRRDTWAQFGYWLRHTGTGQMKERIRWSIVKDNANDQLPLCKTFKTYALMSPLWCLYLIHKSMVSF